MLGQRQTILVKFKSERLWLRLNSTDILVLYTIFERQDYEMASSFAPSLIIDAGAYTGYSSVYFARRYPKARIIAIEPVAANFELLQKNTAGHPNIIALNRALWSANTPVRVVDRQAGFWAFAIMDESAPIDRTLPSVQTTTIDDILRDYQVSAIDLLKMDIEGAEKEVLEHSRTWIGKVAVIAAELHDRFKPGCSDAFYAATRDFTFERKNEMTVFRSRSGPV